MCIFLFFESLREKWFWAFELSAIKNHSLQSHLFGMKFNSKFKFNFESHDLASFANISVTREIILWLNSVFLFLLQYNMVFTDHSFWIFLLICSICVNIILFFLSLKSFLRKNDLSPKESHLRNRDGQFPTFSRLHKQ